MPSQMDRASPEATPSHRQIQPSGSTILGRERCRRAKLHIVKIWVLTIEQRALYWHWQTWWSGVRGVEGLRGIPAKHCLQMAALLEMPPQAAACGTQHHTMHLTTHTTHHTHKTQHAAHTIRHRTQHTPHHTKPHTTHIAHNTQHRQDKTKHQIALHNAHPCHTLSAGGENMRGTLTPMKTVPVRCQISAIEKRLSGPRQHSQVALRLQNCPVNYNTVKNPHRKHHHPEHTTTPRKSMAEKQPGRTW